MANKIKGEVNFRIGGQDYPCTLSIGALAELSEALGIETFDEMGARIARLGPKDVPKIVTAILRGNGHEIDTVALNRLSLDDVMQPFNALMSTGSAAKDTGSKPSPQKAAA